MSDPRASNGYGAAGDDGQHGKDHVSKSASQTTGSQRGVRSTRTPATRTPTSTTPKDAGAGSNPQHEQSHRSQTVPMPAPSATEARTRRTPAPTPTLPVPSTTARQRVPSNPKSRPEATITSSARLPELPNPHPEGKRSLVGTDYIVEPLPSSFRSSEPRSSRDRERERQDPAYLSPHPPPPPSSMPMPTPMLSSDNRHSVSSFQTEPSSYYSVEDNWSSVAGNGPPMPQMPEHRDEEQPPQKRYEELWLAAQANTQAPPMPTPEMAPPPMPSPYHVDTEEEDEDRGGEDDGEEERGAEYEEKEEGQEEQEEQEDHQWVPSREPHARPYAPPKDRYDSSWLAAPSPGMPAPSAVSPPMPSPSVGQPQSTGHIEYSKPNSSQIRPGAGIGVVPSTTAPLRVHHHPRPTGIGPTSTVASSTPATQSQAPAQPSPQRPNFQPLSPGLTNMSSSTPTSTPTPQKYGYETRPPGASAPSVPSAPTTNTTQKPVSVYAQHPLSNVPAKPQGAPTSASMQGSRFEGRPTAPTSTSTTTTATPPQPPQKATAIQSQPNGSSFQPSRPTAALSTASSNAPQKLNSGISQAQSSPLRTQAQMSETRPNRPSISGPQVQHQGSASSSKEKEKEQASAKEHAAASAATATNPTRPRLQGGTPSQNHTQYVNMLLALDDIPALYNILAGFFTWILLAGFILFPGTFTSLQNLNGTTAGLPPQVEQRLVNAVTRLPLFIVAWVCTGIGAVGMVWLWWRWRKNYIWALNKIFLPGLLNSLAGLLSTVANIFGVQHGELSKTSKSTVIVTSAATGALGFLTLFYTFWLVRRVKAKHDREVGKERAGKYGEGVVDLSKRK